MILRFKVVVMAWPQEFKDMKDAREANKLHQLNGELFDDNYKISGKVTCVHADQEFEITGKLLNNQEYKLVINNKIEITLIKGSEESGIGPSMTGGIVLENKDKMNISVSLFS